MRENNPSHGIRLKSFVIAGFPQDGGVKKALARINCGARETGQGGAKRDADSHPEKSPKTTFVFGA